MTDYTIPMIIGMTLAFTLGAGFGLLVGGAGTNGSTAADGTQEYKQ